METKKIAAPSGNGHCNDNDKGSDIIAEKVVNGVQHETVNSSSLTAEDIKAETNSLFQSAKDAQRERQNPFPIEVFPIPIQGVITATNEALKFPIDFIAASILYAASVVIGLTHRIEVMKGWIESAVIYLVLVGHSGANKSHPLSFALKPIHDKDAESFSQYEQQRQEYEIVSALTKKERMEQGYGEPVQPICRKNLVSDFTPEALAKLLNFNKRGLGAYVDEIAGWVKNFGRYNSGSEVEFWLSAWSGKPINIDRKSGEPIFVKKPFVSVAGTIQTGLLSELAKDSRTESGFVSRILFVMPENLKKESWSTSELNQSVIDNWQQVISNLMGLPVENDETNNPLPEILCFTPEAKEALFAWQESNVEKINDEDNDAIKGIYSKMEVYLPRLALILQMLHWACGTGQKQNVGIEALTGALALVQYFERNAIKALALTSNSDPLLKYPENKQQFYKSLPDSFKTIEALGIGEWFDFQERVVKRFLADKQLFNRINRGEYEKQF